MNIVIFCHSLVSDWNHGNAHFLRGIVSELQAREHNVRVYEPRDAWSRQKLVEQHGSAAIDHFREQFPHLHSSRYDLETLDLDQALDHADLVLVHEWNEHELVRSVGEHRARHRGYRLFFHDTHHRSVTAPEQMADYDLRHYDGVLAFGNVIRDLYLEHGWAQHAWTWHEAADVRVFHPMPNVTEREGDLIWIGNWGDGERSAELREFLVEPAAALGLRTRIHGVRYPQHARDLLADAGIDYRGWLPNADAPAAFARFRATVHVPRRPYVQNLPGIPTIRPFEALACGIPLISAPWHDVENLFTPGKDYLVARNGAEMRRHLYDVLHDRELAQALVDHGRRTILQKHTCAHRVDQLLAIYESLNDSQRISAANPVAASAQISHHSLEQL